MSKSERQPELRPLLFDSYRAKCLYAIRQLGERAIQIEVIKYIGPHKSKVSRTLRDLFGHGYLTKDDCYMAGARFIYALQYKNVVTFQDTAKLLITMLEENKNQRTTIVIPEFAKLMQQKSDLGYMDEAHIRERFDRLQEMGYVETAGNHVELRYRTYLEKLYLVLLAEGVPLTELREFQFKGKIQ